MSLTQFTVPEPPKDNHVVYWLVSQVPNLSASRTWRLLKRGAITINGVVAGEQMYELFGGEVVEVEGLKESSLQANPMALDILYEDEEVVVVNKAARIVVHPSFEHRSHTLLNGLVARYADCEPHSPGWPRIVHRLDRDTSGVLIVARTFKTMRFLQRQFYNRTVEKEYLALVLGRPEAARGTIKGPLGHHGKKRYKWAVVEGGRPSTTHYELLEAFAKTSLLLVRPITGRTHQIRVHLKTINLPIAADSLYGRRRRHDLPQLTRQFLHASRLTLTTPDGERRTFHAPLSEELETVLQELRAEPFERLRALPALSFPIAQTHKTYSFFFEVPDPIELVEGFEGIEEFEDLEGEAFEYEEAERGAFEDEEVGDEAFEDEEMEDEDYEIWSEIKGYRKLDVILDWLD